MCFCVYHRVVRPPAPALWRGPMAVTWRQTTASAVEQSQRRHPTACAASGVARGQWRAGVTSWPFASGTGQYKRGHRVWQVVKSAQCSPLLALGLLNYISARVRCATKCLALGGQHSQGRPRRSCNNAQRHFDHNPMGTDENNASRRCTPCPDVQSGHRPASR